MGSATLQNELWNKQPQDWSELQEPHHRPLFSAMLHATSVSKGTVFLDVGCGGGGASVLAAQRGAEVYGVDASKALIHIAAQRMPLAKFETADIEYLPFPTGKFSVTFAANATNRWRAIRTFN